MMAARNVDRFSSDIPTPTRTRRQRLLAVMIIVAIVVVGFGIGQYLMRTKPVARKKPPAKLKTLVVTQAVSPITTNVKVNAFGSVIAAQEIDLQARVAGTVQYLHPDYQPGGIIKQGEVIVRLDDTDYQLNLRNKKDTLAQAEAELRLEKGNQIIARQEWELLGQYEDLETSSEDLALRQPQLEKVEAEVSAARTEVERARVDLERTVIRAPFNAMVREKRTDLGSQVSSQSIIAVLTGIDTFWAEVSVPVEKLAWIVMPGNPAGGSRVLVHGSSELPYEAGIVSLLPELDKDGLMARLLIEVPDPMQLTATRVPLLLGSFVRIEFGGKQLEDVYRIPRSALKDDGLVLIATPEDRLRIQPVSVVWRTKDYVFVDQGLRAGDRLIVSKVAAPIEGMALEMTGAKTPAPSASGEVEDHESKQ